MNQRQQMHQRQRGDAAAVDSQGAGLNKRRRFERTRHTKLVHMYTSISAQPCTAIVHVNHKKGWRARPFTFDAASPLASLAAATLTCLTALSSIAGYSELLRQRKQGRIVARD